MIKIETIFTEADAGRILIARGLNVQERDAVLMDGERECDFRQLQVQNPFTGEWEPAEAAFRRMAGRAAEEELIERMMTMDLMKCFKNE